MGQTLLRTLLNRNFTKMQKNFNVIKNIEAFLKVKIMSTEKDNINCIIHKQKRKNRIKINL